MVVLRLSVVVLMVTFMNFMAKKYTAESATEEACRTSTEKTRRRFPKVPSHESQEPDVLSRPTNES